MNLQVMTMPDEPKLLAKWLEQQLVGDRLGELVEELVAVHGASAAGESFRADALRGILQRGLSGLSEAEMTRLLRQPQDLLELQELVFLEGGDYWRSVPRPPSLTAASERLWDALAAKLPNAEPIIPLVIARERRRANPWVVALATAAAVLLTVFAIDRFSIPPTPVTSLAAVGRAWFDKRPDDRPALAQRLNDLRRGCSQLLLSENPNWTDDQQQDLKKRCRIWAAKFDASLVKLEAGGDFDEVREEVDSTVRKLVDLLQSHA